MGKDWVVDPINWPNQLVPEPFPVVTMGCFVAAVRLLLLLPAAFMEWALNWAMFCARLDVPYLVIAFDAEAAAALHMHGIPVHDASTEPGVPSLPDIRMDFAVLRQMVSDLRGLQRIMHD